MIITEFFAQLRVLGFYDEVRKGGGEALRLDIQGQWFIIVRDDELRIPDGSRPIFIGLNATDGTQLDSRLAPSFKSAMAIINRIMSGLDVPVPIRERQFGGFQVMDAPPRKDPHMRMPSSKEYGI